MGNGALGRLVAWAQARAGESFAWGQNDCAILCLEALDAMAGTALAAAHRGQYATRRGSLRYQRRVGMNLADQLERAGVFAVAQPRAGDILTHPHPKFPWVVGHVCFGAVALTAREDQGVCWVESGRVMAMPGAKAWRAACPQ